MKPNNWELGSVPPCEFIPIAEENSMIVAIGEWVMRTACRQAQEWIDSGHPIKRIAVNVSINQFIHPDFLTMLEQVLKESMLVPQNLEIEITERLILKNPTKVSSVLHRLREMGVQVAIDDFGTGYSSLSRLKEVPIDCLKIDRSFINGIDSAASKGDQSIIAAIIAMAKGLELRLIAEGVETSGQVDFLKDNQCREVQGFLFSRPLSPENIETLFKKIRTK